MQGMSPISNHQPLRPVSCNLLTASPRPGRRRGRETRYPTQGMEDGSMGSYPIAMSTGVATMDRIPLNKKNHQYSEREALPEKFT